METWVFCHYGSKRYEDEFQIMRQENGKWHCVEFVKTGVGTNSIFEHELPEMDSYAM